MTADLETLARQLLADLGRTREEVATTLTRLGVTGIPGTPRYCPIARYLQGNGVPATYVSCIRVVWEGGPLSGVLVLDPVSDFVTAFDDEPDDFPALVDGFRP